MKAIDTRRPSRLDLNAPLLSARRSSLAAMSKIEVLRSNSLNGSCDRVPFVWEQSPGKPKDNVTGKNNVLEEVKPLPLPKPPPIRWLEKRPTLALQDVSGGVEKGYEEEDEDEEEEDDKCDFSDAIDLLSLAESLNGTSERLDRDNNVRENVDFECDTEEDNNGSLSPSFMIQRFLPAATALAASSLSALASNKDVVTSDKQVIMPVFATTSNNSTKEGPCMPRRAGEVYSSSKGCGLEMLFPWRVKHRVCGVKSPVRRAHTTSKPRLSPRK